MTGRLDEEEAAVYAAVLDIPLALRRELFPKVGRVLVFDVLDNWVPAIFVSPL